jgi:AcrR family transcriptional regulator
MSTKRQPSDRRARRTRRQLQQALLQLLGDEPMSKVTVSQIAARADVSRQAFYLHFGSKEELLLSQVDDLFEEVRAMVLPSPARPRAVGLQDLIAASFAEWARHACSLAIAMQIEDKDQVMERMRVHVADLMDMFARHGRDEVVASPMREYLVDFFTGGVYMLLRSWIRDGLATPSTQLADLTYGILSSQLSSRHTRPRGWNLGRGGSSGGARQALPDANINRSAASRSGRS